MDVTKDPVCGMNVEDKSPHTSTSAGQTYRFCSPDCKKEFDRQPDRYAVAADGKVLREVEA
jgi:Cu+-exporting ATPase